VREVPERATKKTEKGRTKIKKGESSRPTRGEQVLRERALCYEKRSGGERSDSSNLGTKGDGTTTAVKKHETTSSGRGKSVLLGTKRGEDKLPSEAHRGSRSTRSWVRKKEEPPVV